MQQGTQKETGEQKMQVATCAPLLCPIAIDILKQQFLIKYIIRMDENMANEVEEVDQSMTDELDDAPLDLLSYPSTYSDTPKLAYTYSGISNTSSNADVLLLSRFSETQTQKVKFLKPNELYSSIKSLIDEMKMILVLEDDLILYLLYKYKWSSQRLNEIYYDYALDYQEKNLQLLKKSIKQKNLCNICYEERQLIRNPLCSHGYCVGCWQQFIFTNLEEGRIFFSCMEKCHDSPLLFDSFIAVHLPDLIPKYRKNICINYCQFSRLITYCPERKGPCDLFCSKTETMMQSLVECQCGCMYCFQCRKQPHYPATCSDVTQWEQLLNKQEENVNWIKKNTKKCPKCKNAVEKSIGCSYIKCMCGTQFCYKCNQLWNQFHKDQKGECMKMIRKDSLKEKDTSQKFLILQQRLQQRERIKRKNLQSIQIVLSNIPEEDYIYEKFHELRREVYEAQQEWKWGLIVLFIYQKQMIDSFLEDDYLNSILRLAEPIYKISKKQPQLQKLEVKRMGDELMNKRQKMNKSHALWMQAWRSS